MIFESSLERRAHINLGTRNADVKIQGFPFGRFLWGGGANAIPPPSTREIPEICSNVEH